MMAWVRLDDQFPSHPKMVLAGGDAAWLHVCALCYCGQHLTDGRFPKGIVARLSDRKKPGELAARLVEVGAWIDHGDEYEIHDYLLHNPSREKVLAEREAARERRSRDGKTSGERRANRAKTSGDVRANVMNPDPAPIEEAKASSRKAERDALFDALVDTFGTATTPQRQKHYGKTVTTLLSLSATPDEVRRRGKNLAARGWDNPSPEALLKWWDTLDAGTKASSEPELVRDNNGRRERFMLGTGWVAEG